VLKLHAEVESEALEMAMLRAELMNQREQWALDALKANIRAEVMQVLTSDEMINAVPIENRGLFKLLANLT
jgi:hypothetical protein